jgi:hypothetical protein
MEIPLPRAPRTLYPEISVLCERLVPGGTSVYLKTESVAGTFVNDCYGNVDRMIAKNGGVMQCGWQIWETLPGVMIEGEFHAVWVDAKGDYHDITPKAISGINTILFLPDSTRKYEDRQIDNERISLVSDSLLDQFIKNEKSYFEAMNQGDLGDYHGVVVMTDKMKEILKRKMQLGTAIIEKYYNSDESKSS